MPLLLNGKGIICADGCYQKLGSWFFELLCIINPLSANPTKWLNTLKQFIGKSPANYLSVFVDFVDFVIKELMNVGVVGMIEQVLINWKFYKNLINGMKKRKIE